MMRRFVQLFTLLLLLQACLAGLLYAQAGNVRSETVISDPIRVDRVYKSMEGPHFMQPIPILDQQDKDELLWLKKVRLEFIDGKKDEPRPINHLCHSHILADDAYLPALFTLIQGQNAVELPGNFAVPVLTKYPLIYYAQILNLKETQEPYDIRVKTTVEYIRDAELTEAQKPLNQIALILRIPIEEETAAMIAENHEGCDTPLMSKDGTVEIVPSNPVTLRKDSKGQNYSYHWMVPPGKHTYTYDLERKEIKSKAKEATIHFATIHLHPYGRSMELLDLTANASVLKIDVNNYSETGGIESVNSFFSEAGVPFYPDHQYRITTEYENPTQESIDAMAFLYLYLYDEESEKELVQKKARLSQEKTRDE